MDPDRPNTWKQIRSRFAGRHRALGIRALVAAMLFCGTKKPSSGADTRKDRDDSEKADRKDNKRADEDAAA